MSIPKVIHQTARGFETLPQDFKDNVQRFKALGPDRIYRFYDGVASKDYIRKSQATIRR